MGYSNSRKVSIFLLYGRPSSSIATNYSGWKGHSSLHECSMKHKSRRNSSLYERTKLADWPPPQTQGPASLGSIGNFAETSAWDTVLVNSLARDPCLQKSFGIWCAGPRGGEIPSPFVNHDKTNVCPSIRTFIQDIPSMPSPGPGSESRFLRRWRAWTSWACWV